MPYKKSEAYKKAHARYMRYFRSVHESPRLSLHWMPPEPQLRQSAQVQRHHRKSEKWHKGRTTAPGQNVKVGKRVHVAHMGLHGCLMPHLCNASGKTLNGSLYEAWVSCGGNWTKSKLYLSLSTSTTNRRQGKRRWMTKKIMLQKFGDATDDIIYRKTSDPELREKEVRCHPEAPLRQDPGNKM